MGISSEFTLDLSKFEEDLGRLVNPQDVHDLLLTSGQSAALYLEENLFDAPDQGNVSHTPPYTITLKDGSSKLSWFKTRKSQRWYWAALKRGEIIRPYKRTGFLGNEITVQVRVEGWDVVISVGTTLDYAPYVIGELQTKMHRDTGWVLLTTSVEESREAVERAFVSHLYGRYNQYL